MKTIRSKLNVDGPRALPSGGLRGEDDGAATILDFDVFLSTLREAPYGRKHGREPLGPASIQFSAMRWSWMQTLDKHADRVKTSCECFSDTLHPAQSGARVRQSVTRLHRRCAASDAAQLLRLLHPKKTAEMALKIDDAVNVCRSEHGGCDKAQFRVVLQKATEVASMLNLEWSRGSAYVVGWMQARTWAWH